MTGNEVSLWLMGARRTMDRATLTAHITAQMAMDTDGRAFWTAALALHTRLS